jgi:glycosyltransferase involved in cell wall biosynthesis
MKSGPLVGVACATMAQAPPTVSVVIPTRNRLGMLRVALSSVLCQVGVDLEVVVVDDASSDGTPERLAALGDPRLKVIANEVNVGVSRARNIGIDAARGTWIAFLDDDDFWGPGKLEAHLARAESEGAEWVYGAMVFIDPHGEPTRIGRVPTPADLARQLLVDNVIGGPSSVAVKARLLERTGGFDERLSILADWDLWLRLNEVARPAACHEPLVGYMHHAENMQLVQMNGLPDELRYLAAKHPGADRHFGRKQLLEGRALENRLARRRLAAAALYLRAAAEFGARRNVSRALGALAGDRVRTRLSRRRPLPRREIAWVSEALAGPDRNRL